MEVRRTVDTPVRKAGETDTSFDPGDTFNFTCRYVVPAGVTSVVNTASVCGTYTPDTMTLDLAEREFFERGQG